MSKVDDLAKRRRQSSDFVDPDAVDVQQDDGSKEAPSSTNPSLATTATQTATAPNTPPRRRAPRPLAADGRPKKSVNVVYVSEAVKKRFDAQRHKTKKQSHQLVLEAISQQRGQLGDIIANSRFSTAPVDDLFPEDPTAVRYLGGGSSQIHYNITPEQDAVLESLTAELGFEKRSTWIAPVLNNYLSGRKEKLGERG